jgi:hypothetical protein
LKGTFPVMCQFVTNTTRDKVHALYDPVPKYKVEYISFMEFYVYMKSTVGKKRNHI